MHSCSSVKMHRFFFLQKRFDHSTAWFFFDQNATLLFICFFFKRFDPFPCDWYAVHISIELLNGTVLNFLSLQTSPPLTYSITKYIIVLLAITLYN